VTSRRAGEHVNPFYHSIYKVVRHIPKGRIATYGLVARLAGRPGAARTVGWALSALPDDSDVPWWRVLNAAGLRQRARRPHPRRFVPQIAQVERLAHVAIL